MTGQPITPAMRAAFGVARAAMQRATPHGPADAIVVDLDAAGLLQSPETAAELYRLRQERAALNGVLAGADQERGLLTARPAELRPYEALHPQLCEAGQHRGWFADADGPLPCPWCQIAVLEQSSGVVYRAEQHDMLLGTYASADAAGACAESALRALVPAAICVWEASADREGLIELMDDRPQGGSPRGRTGFAVVTVTVEAEYTPAVTA